MRLAQAVAFGRHLPLHKIARRVELMVRRHARDRWPALAGNGNCATPFLAAHSQSPLFAPRRSHLAIVGSSITFSCLGQTLQIGDLHGDVGMDWDPTPDNPDAQLWLMNLHYMEYLEEVPDGLFATLVSDWILRNRPDQRGAWRHAWNAYTVSIRSTVWMQQLGRRSARLDHRFCTEAYASLSQQIRFLERNLETDIGGNHLIKNVKALIWASVVFSGPEAANWRAMALRILHAELAKQVLDDGMHYERSPSYHCQVLADLLEIRSALRCDPTGGVLDDTLHRMAQAAADLTHPDGHVALFNDAGLSMAYPPEDCLAAHHTLFGTRPRQRGVFALHAGGYFGLRTPDSYLVIDCGRLGPDDLPAHAHGDALSFEWSIRGRRVIVDQGVFQYRMGPRRQAARASASHNTLSIDGADQADFFGAFRCGRRPQVDVRHWRLRPEGFVLEGAHDGYRHLPGRPIHVRRFEVDAERIVIHDRIEGELRNRASIAFLLHPDAEPRRADGRMAIRFDGGEVVVESPGPVMIEDAVWWPDMGQERTTKRLRIGMAAGSPLTTVLRIARSGAS